MKQIIRVAHCDINGDKYIYGALRKINGVSYSFSNAICRILSFEMNRKIGTLIDEEVKKIEDVIKNPSKYNIPFYLYNRRKDREDGTNKHLTGPELKLRKEFDVKHLKKIKCYRGFRHAVGLPVRGQRTKAHFRKGASVGVKKKAAKMAQAKKKG